MAAALDQSSLLSFGTNPPPRPSSIATVPMRGTPHTVVFCGQNKKDLKCFWRTAGTVRTARAWHGAARPPSSSSPVSYLVALSFAHSFQSAFAAFVLSARRDHCWPVIDCSYMATKETRLRFRPTERATDALAGKKVLFSPTSCARLLPYLSVRGLRGAEARSRRRRSLIGQRRSAAPTRWSDPSITA